MQKWSNMTPKRFFDFLVKWKDLWSFSILQKLFAVEKSRSQVIAKCLWPMRCHYSLIDNISWMDWHETWFFEYRWTWMKGTNAWFWAWTWFPLLTLYAHSETGQEVHESYVDGFSKKVLIHGKWAFLGWKMKHLVVTLNWL